MGALALTETANPLIWSPTKTRLNPATVSRVIPMRVAKARFEPKPVDAADRTFRRYGREAVIRCYMHQGQLCADSSYCKVANAGRLGGKSSGQIIAGFLLQSTYRP
jgi:hypothetical protein